jgi:hypothetical protein
VVVEVLPVASELVFTVHGSEATPAESVTLADAGLRERDDLQEWVLRHPQLLGRGVMIITFEFDQWWSGSGSRERDRLDVLGLGDDGRLVVAELKRDRAPDTVEMQAIKYAAMASRFTEEALVDQLARFRMRQGFTADEDTVRELLATHVGGEIDSELLKKPRIVLVAGGFPPAGPGVPDVGRRDCRHGLAAVSRARRRGVKGVPATGQCARGRSGSAPRA